MGALTRRPLAWALLALAVAPSAAEAAPLLPDLGAKVADVRMARVGDRDELRFSGIVVNRGVGPFELRVVRAGPGSPWAVQQRVLDSAGPPALAPTAARMVFGGDGHGHWHVRDLARYELRRAAGGPAVARLHKQGFCFFDTDRLAGPATAAPRAPVYGGDSCGGRRSRGLTMGLSVGWGDRYSWRLSDQFLDVTGLPAGRYRLWATADAPGLFVEEDEADNATWADVAITRRGGVARARVVARAPAPVPAPAPAPGP
ncbi:lysyl oxidase family protein [Miltoncostaea marina]|uniref:lysyl oxidase family protein n=1 Tax=Miltoncostaea marina TaxID=2843215 RepID=UPI001C3C54CD|nr:lysyl oxidase family protein [Miltoncostaea marina]